MSWLFSQALVEEYSGESYSGGEPCAPLNVMPTPQPFWRNDKTMDVLSRSPFGLTWKPLTESRGEELLMSFRAVFRARTSARQEKVKALPGPDQGFGQKWRASFARFDPDTSSWRTHQHSLLGGLELYSETWPKWGSMRNGECLERQTLERPTGESVSGYWQTPVADDAVQRELGKWNSRGEPKLSAQVMLPTPRATDWDKNTRTPEGAMREAQRKGGGPQDLGAAVALFPIPTVCGNHNRKGASATSGDGLATVVNKDSLGQLNPTWVEWLMGWPIGWTDLKPLGMDRFQEWLRQHGEP